MHLEHKIEAFLRNHRLLVLIVSLLLALLLPVITAVQAIRVAGLHWRQTEEIPPETTAPLTQTTSQTTTVATETTTTTTTAATTTTAPPPPPAACMIEDVPYYSQRGLLPTGCELVSAKMLLEYYTHEEVDIQDIIDRVDCQYPVDVGGIPCAPHPYDAFIGSPWDPTSFGCFSGIICDMMNDLLPKNYMAVDTSDTDLAELAETYLPQGRPVLVWATISMVSSFPHMGWYISDEHCQPTDEWYDWRANEHCLVLIGYDEQYYYFNDPYLWNGGTKYARDIVEKRYEEIGRYSAVVVPRPAEVETPETYVMVRTPETTTTVLTTDST